MNESNNLVLLAASLEISLIAFVVGGFFLSQAYGALIYVLVALALVATRLAGRLVVAERRTVRSPRGAGAGTPSSRRFGKPATRAKAGEPA